MLAMGLGCRFINIKSCIWESLLCVKKCLFWVELPFAEDLRTFTFGSLPVTDDTEVNKKYKPTDEQLDCMDQLITNMDLSQALEDEDGDKEEAFKPKLTFNPYFQRVYQCLQHRVLNPDEGLPNISPVIDNYLHPPPGVKNTSQPCLEKLQKLFKLEVMEQKKEEQTGENMFKDMDADAGPAPKKLKLEDGLEGGIQMMTKGQVSKVGSVTPIEDFKTLINRKDCDMFDEACQQMQKLIEQIVMDSFGQKFYPKAIDCLKALREECIQKSEPDSYNQFIQNLKDRLIGKGRRDFWDWVVREKQSLISKPECEESKVTKEEADKFTQGEVKVEESTRQEEEETTDDLLMEL